MAVVTDVIDAVDALLAVDPAALSTDRQLDEMSQIIALDHKVQALKAQRVQALHDAEATVEHCGRQTKRWLVEEMRLEPGAAGALMRLGRGLRHAPATADAFAAGDINDDHALLILKVLRHVDDDDLRVTVEAELVRLARRFPPFVVAQAVDRVLTLLGVEQSTRAAHERRFAERGVGLDETLGGTGSLHGTLTPELREKLTGYFASRARTAGAEDDRTLRQRQHDALDELVDFGLAHIDGLSPVDGERPRLVVHIDYRVLAGLVEGHQAIATLGSGTVVPAATARRLACDAQLLPVVLGADSEVLDIGSASRHPTAAITRATYLRDGGHCAFPRCTNRNLRQHHIQYWADWHHTSYDVMCWVCPFHHWLVHEGGWTLRRVHGRIYHWTSPTGFEVRTPPPRDPLAA